MHQDILDFLNNERICSLATVLEDGTPHSATMHYSFTSEPFELYFSTHKTSRKLSNITNSHKAAFLIGFSEEEWKTFQVEGEMQLVSNDQISKVKENHYSRNPSSKKFEGDPNTVFLKFVPTWWRYTDYKVQPMKILSSDK